MKWTEILSGLTNRAFQQFMGALGEKADVAVNRINNEPIFAERLAQYAINGAVEPSVSQQKARFIMGKNFFGIEEAIKYFGVNPTNKQLCCLEKIPWNEETLMSCKDTYILVAVFPITIIDMFMKYRSMFFLPEKETIDFCAKYPEIMGVAGEISWQLINKKEVKDSEWKTLDDQKKLLSENEEIPTAQTLVYIIIGYRAMTDERLFIGQYLRSSSISSKGMHIEVGHYYNTQYTKGLCISEGGDNYRSSGHCIVSAQK